jgi:hypothetical protein
VAEWSINHDPAKDESFDDSLGIRLAMVVRGNSLNDVPGGFPGGFVWMRQQARYGWQGGTGLWSDCSKSSQAAQSFGGATGPRLQHAARPAAGKVRKPSPRPPCCGRGTARAPLRWRLRRAGLTAPAPRRSSRRASRSSPSASRRRAR